MLNQLQNCSAHQSLNGFAYIRIFLTCLEFSFINGIEKKILKYMLLAQVANLA